jgi:hypothetical protein
MKQLLILVGISLLLGCVQQDLPQGGGKLNQAIFQLQGQIDGQELHWIAGENGHFMQTNLLHDAQGVYEMQGSIQLPVCNPCPPSIRIHLRDFERNPAAGSMQVDSAIRKGFYSFQQGISGQSLRLVQLQQQSFGGTLHQPTEHRWQILHIATNRIVAQLSGESPSLPLRPGEYQIGLTTEFSNGCSNSLTKRLQIGESMPNCAADFRIMRFQGTTVAQLDTFETNFTGPVSSYHWIINGQVDTRPQPFLFFDSIPSPVFPVSLVISDGNCSLTITKNISRNPDAFCTANFRIQQNNAIDPLQLGRVRIDYFDGQEWLSSAYEGQDSRSFFEIESVDPFEINGNGLPTRKISGRLEVTLYSADGRKQRQLKQARFIWALPFKP